MSRRPVIRSGRTLRFKAALTHKNASWPPAVRTKEPFSWRRFPLRIGVSALALMLACGASAPAEARLAMALKANPTSTANTAATAAISQQVNYSQTLLTRRRNEIAARLSASASASSIAISSFDGTGDNGLVPVGALTEVTVTEASGLTIKGWEGAGWSNVLLTKKADTADADGKYLVQLTQTGPSASAYWKTFNVGSKTTLDIVQKDAGGSDQTGWVLINNLVNDSLIYGSVKAPGQVYNINKPTHVYQGASIKASLYVISPSGEGIAADALSPAGGLSYDASLGGWVGADGATPWSNAALTGIIRIDALTGEQPKDAFGTTLANTDACVGPCEFLVPVTSDGRYRIDIGQTAEKAKAYWNEFNVGARTTLNIVQSDVNGIRQPEWILLNKSTGSSASTISGNVIASGETYIINTAGISFASGANVLLHTLLASSLDINKGLKNSGNAEIEDVFDNGIVDESVTRSVDPQFLSDPDAVASSVTVAAGATITASSGGAVMLFGPNVVNNGEIVSPSGQVILAAGKAVRLEKSTSTSICSKDAVDLRGLSVAVGGPVDDSKNPGTAVNNGTIVAELGNITMIGRRVEQLGDLFATSSIDDAGTIFLRAVSTSSTGTWNGTAVVDGGQPYSFDSGVTKFIPGPVTLGAGSLTMVLPNVDDTTTLSTSSALTIVSRIDILGSSVTLQGATAGAEGASVYVPSGKVTVEATAGNAGITEDYVYVGDGSKAYESTEWFNDGSRVYLGDGASIDVSGLFVNESVADNILKVQVQQSQLNDSPVQTLNGDPFYEADYMYVDLRKTGTRADGSSWIGTPLFHVEGYIGITGKTVAQMSTTGGSVKIYSGGDIIVAPTAKIDVSGGGVNYTGSTITTTTLKSDGRTYEISNASPDLVYTSYGVPMTVYDPGYVEGASAGSIFLTAPALVIDSGASLVGKAIVGPYQRQLHAVWPAGDSTGAAIWKAWEALSIPVGGTLAISSTVSVSTGMGSATNPAPVVSSVVLGAADKTLEEEDLAFDPATSALPEDRQSAVYLPEGIFNDGGFTNIAIVSGGRIVLPRKTRITLASGASSMSMTPNATTNVTTNTVTSGALVSLTAFAIDVEGTLWAPGGSIELTTKQGASLASVTDAFDGSGYYSEPLLLDDGDYARNLVYGSVSVASGATLSTRGLWINDLVSNGAYDTPTLINGGSTTLTVTTNANDSRILTESSPSVSGGISISSFSNVSIAAGSTLDVSGGAWLKSDGSIVVGSGGTIDIASTGASDPWHQAVYHSPSMSVSFASFKGFGLATDSSVGKGGTLSVTFGGAIQIGGDALDPNILALDPGAIRLSPEIFTENGFSSYSITAPLGLTVYKNTIVAPQARSLLLNYVAVKELATNGDVTSVNTKREKYATETLLPAARRPAVSLALKSSGSAGTNISTDIPYGVEYNGTAWVQTQTGYSAYAVTVQEGASIIGETGASIVIAGSIFTDIAGTVEARAGSITLGSNTAYATDAAVDFGRWVHLWSTSRIEAGGTKKDTAVSSASDLAKADASVLAGGTVKLLGGVLADSGSLVDVSGYSDWIKLAGTPASLPGAKYQNVYSSGGSITIDSVWGFNLAGSMIGTAGDPRAQGGTFTAILEGQFTTNGPIGDATIVVRPDSSAGFTQGQGNLNAGLLAQGGFDTVRLSARDKVLFKGSATENAVALEGARNIIIDSRTISADAGTSVLIGGASTAYVDLVNNWLYVYNLDQASSSPSANLTVMASLVDIEGQVALDNFATATVQSESDIRFEGSSGSLFTQKDLTLAARQVYVTTFADFTVMAAGVLTIDQVGEAGDIPLSAGGSLTFEAPEIHQNGTVRAPLGTISFKAGTVTDGTGAYLADGTSKYLADGSDNYYQTSGVYRTIYNKGTVLPAGTKLAAGVLLDGTGSVSFGGNSLTSASADGKTIPYGQTQNSLLWTYIVGTTGSTDTTSTTVTQSPQKEISVTAAKITLADGAQSDVSGGGDVTAWEFTTGRNGTNDVLDDSGTNTGKIFAILPQFYSATVSGLGVAPYDPSNYSSYAAKTGVGVDATLTTNIFSTWGVGSVVYLSDNSVVKAGYYLLLPARYALLSGGVKISLTATGVDNAVANSTAQPGGTYAVVGKMAVANSNIIDSRNSLFQLTPNSIINHQAQYTTTLGNSFFPSYASRTGIAALRTAQDAGAVVFHVTPVYDASGNLTSTLDLEGQLKMAGYGSGAGGELDLDAIDIAVLGSSQKAAEAAAVSDATPGNSYAENGFLVLTDSQLAASGAQSILLGGYRTQETDGLHVTVDAQQVVVDNSGSSLAVPELIVVATGAADTSSGTAPSQEDAAKANATSGFFHDKGIQANAITVTDNSTIVGNGTLQGTPSDLIINPVQSDIADSGWDYGAVLRVSNGAATVVNRLAALDTKVGTLAIGAGATIGAAGNSVLFDATSAASTRSSTVLKGDSLTVGGPRISFGAPAGSTTGLVFAGLSLSNLQDVKALKFRSSSTIDFYGDLELGSAGLTSLTFDAAGLVGYLSGSASTVVSVTGQTVSFINSGATFTTASGQTVSTDGSFTVAALSSSENASSGTIILGKGDKTLSGFATVVLGGDKEILLEGTGTTTLGGADLTLRAPGIVGGSSGNQSITTAGKVTLKGVPGHVNVSSSKPGTIFSVTASSIEMQSGSVIELPSGTITLTATGSGGITVLDGAEIDAEGASPQFFDVTEYENGGTVNLVSAGKVDMQGGTVKVGASGDADAGTLAIDAASGFALGDAATLEGAATNGEGGLFKATYQTLSADELSLLAGKLSSTGFNGGLDIRVKSGDIVVAATLTAHTVSLSADQGTIDVEGTIDASGRIGGTKKTLLDGGSITLSSGNYVDDWNTGASPSITVSGHDIVLAAGSQLLAKGRTGTVDGSAYYGAGGTVSLATESGVIRTAGSTIDASPGDGATDRTKAGRIRYRLPRVNASAAAISDLLAGTAITFQAGNAAHSIQVEEFKIYDRTADGSIDNAKAAIISDAKAFYASGDGVKDTDINAALWYAPGAEVVNTTGDLTLSSTFDFFTAMGYTAPTYDASQGGAVLTNSIETMPGFLTLKAAGNINIKADLTDGFATVTATEGVSDNSSGTNPALSWATNDSVLMAGYSWTFHLVAGADASAADADIVRSGAGDVVVGNPHGTAGTLQGAAYYDTQGDAIDGSAITSARIRTGTGDIDIAAGGNISLLGAYKILTGSDSSGTYKALNYSSWSTIYTGGREPVVATDPDDPSVTGLYTTTAYIDPYSPWLAGDGSLGAADIAAAGLEFFSFDGYTANGFQQLWQAFPVAGGNITVTAKGDIASAISKQLVSDWLMKGYNITDPWEGGNAAVFFGLDTNFAHYADGSAIRNYALQLAWWPRYDLFKQGIGALGGGNVSVTAGGNIVDLSVVSATNGRNLTPLGEDITTSTASTVVQGGGNVFVHSGGDIESGLFYVEKGVGSIIADGSITTSNEIILSTIGADSWGGLDNPGAHIATLLAVGDAQLTVQAANTLEIETIFNPTSLSGLVPRGSDEAITGTLSQIDHEFFTYTDNTSVTLRSLAGDAVLDNSYDTISSIGYGGNPYLSLNMTVTSLNSELSTSGTRRYIPTAFGYFPGTLTVEADQGDVDILGGFSMVPSSSGNLDILANGSINLSAHENYTINSTHPYAYINVSDVDQGLIPSITNPVTSIWFSGYTKSISHSTPTDEYNISYTDSTKDDKNVLLAITMSNQTTHAATPVHIDDPVPSHLYAVSDDIVNSETSAGQSSTIFLAESVEIRAGRDIKDLDLYAQNVYQPQSSESVEPVVDLTLVAAGRDIIYRSMTSGTLTGITLLGDGVLEVDAGRNIDLANSRGLLTVGNGASGANPAWNTALSSTGADLTVMAGLGSGSDAVREPDYDAVVAKYLDPATADAALSAYYLGLWGNEYDYLWNQANTGKKSRPTNFNYGTHYAYTVEDQQNSSIASVMTSAEAWAAWQRLATVNGYSTAQKAFLRNLVQEEFARAGAVNASLPLSEKNYKRGYDALTTFLPGTSVDVAGYKHDAVGGSYSGSLIMYYSKIRTDAGGSIGIFVPGGNIDVGLARVKDVYSSSNQQTDPMGILTMRGGAFGIVTSGTVNVNQSRIFSRMGGDGLIWATSGDIDAGNGAKTSLQTLSQTVVIDGDGNVTLYPGGVTTGAGIGVLKALAGDENTSDIYLVAPVGTINAGEAGIRATGGGFLSAARFANLKNNVDIAGGAMGLPPAAAATSVAAPAAPDSAANSAEEAAQRLSGLAAARNGAPAVVTVHVVGYGGTAEDARTLGTGEDSRQRDTTSGDSQNESRQQNPDSPVQIVGAGNLSSREMLVLTDEEKRNLVQ